MRRLIFRLHARFDIAEAADWYERQSVGLGVEFVRAVNAMVASIHRNPEQYQRIRGRLRRAALRRFPYGIFYVSSADEVTILGCIHGKRHPRRWRQRT
jgi:plasmid stabilization system protein ParE